jgi:hypothetical protein
MLQGSHTGLTPVMLWEGLSQSDRLRRGRHRLLQLDTGRHRFQMVTGRYRLQSAIQAKVPALTPTFRSGILATAAVVTSSWRASPVMGNASVDDTDATTAVTFLFDGKSFVHTFN